MKRVLSLILTLAMVIGIMPQITLTAGAVESAGNNTNPYEGKTVSILSHSASTYTGVSNDATSNSTIGVNDVYYTEGRHDVYREDTWWQQAIDALGMELLVNNSWSGSCVFMPRKGKASVGYGNRAVNLHNDRTGEEPDVIFVYLGCNDFAYYKDTFGKEADMDYAQLILDNGDGTFTYTEPTTTCDAYAIMLHKATTRYPDAEIFCMTSTARRETDYTGDTYPDAGQPTEYSAQLQKVAAHFGFPVVDLEQAIPKEVAVFDRYMGDKRAHPNALGMDQITNAVLSVMLGKDSEIRHVTSEDGTVAEQAVLLGGSYHAEVELSEGYSAIVTMNGVDVTDEAYSTGKISIDTVTGDISVLSVIQRDPLNFRWEVQNNALASVGDADNSLSKLAGTIESGVLSNTRYQLSTSVVLKHDLPWEVEWKCAEDWRGAMLASHEQSATKGMTYLTRTKGGQLCFGTYTGSQYNNYGVDLSSLDGGIHTYRLENRIATDGSNMIWLYVDGEEIGPMNNYFIGSNTQNKTSDWLSGKDFVFPFIGMTGHEPRNCRLDYLSVTECDHACTNGTCTGCGAKDPNTVASLSLRYDDPYDVTGKTVEIIDAGAPTSYQVGYGVAENTVRDTAVVTLTGNTLVATGIGTAKVKIDGQIYEITVTAAPISLLLLIGQSNMEGNEGEAKQSIVCPDGMVYATYGDRYDMVLENATHYAPSALTGEYRTINTAGGTDGLNDYPVYMLTDEGDGRKGPDSGFAYEWVKQTGEKVWIVNAAHGGTSLDVWQPGTTQYEECQAMFGACQETLRKEIAAGHFTLSHMAYFWCQGCNDYNKTAEWYVENYLSMHESLNEELAFDHDGNASTPAKQFELAGIIPVRAGHSWRTGYRAGTYTDTTNKSSYESFVDLQMTGPRVAQYWMCNNPELEEIVLVCNIGEDWVWMPDGTNGVSEYFQSHYQNGTVDYTTQVAQKAAWYTPTTPAAVHDSIHYNQIGYNEVGRESVRNALIYMGINPDYEEETTVKFVGWTGYKEVSSIETSVSGSSGTLAVPIVTPVTRSKSVEYTLSEGLSYVYYDLLAESVNVAGTLTSSNTENTVSVTPRSLDSYTWHFDGNNLASSPDEGDLDNPLTLLGGSVTDGAFNGIRYQLSRSICLNHDQEWGLEIKLSDWNAPSGSMILSGGSAATSGQPYVYFRPTDFFVGFGYYDGTQYNNYGISLKEHGIACNEGSHTYRFVNRIAADGSNTIWLYVDDEEVAPLSEYYVNSTLKDAASTGLSGKDFVLSYIGTSDFSVKGCVINTIRIAETGYDPNIHLHTWSEWETELAPSEKGPGIEKRNCIECGNTQSREVEGVWQKYDLDDHMIALPAEYCGETNLWPMLPHDAEYYHSGVRWDTNGNVHSVTFAVSGGEQIFATSFGKRGTNGAPSSDGIRLTFFGLEGVLKTTSPQETYAEFIANGGYIVAPEGAVAVNVPMYDNSNTNELYILNRDHCYKNGVCQGCGASIAPVITQQPTDVEAALGENYCVTVEAEGENVTFYWEYRDGETDAWKDAQCSARALCINAVSAEMHGRQFRCTISNEYGTIVSEAATLTVKVAEPELNDAVYGTSVAATDSLEMFFYLLKSEVESTDYVQVTRTFGDGRADEVNVIPSAEWVSQSSDLWKIDGGKFAAKQMTDKVYVQVFNADGTPSSNVLEDSIRDYALRRYEKVNDEMKSVFVDILNYGAAAQEYFGYAEDDLANAGLTEEQKAFATGDIICNDYRIKGENYYGSMVSAESNIKFTFYFQNLTTDMTATVKFTDHYGNEHEISINGEDFEIRSKDLTGIAVTELAVADARQLVECNVYQNGTLFASAADSLESYVARMANDDQPVYGMLMKFAASTYNYFH